MNCKPVLPAHLKTEILDSLEKIRASGVPHPLKASGSQAALPKIWHHIKGRQSESPHCGRFFAEGGLRLRIDQSALIVRFYYGGNHSES